MQVYFSPFIAHCIHICYHNYLITFIIVCGHLPCYLILHFMKLVYNLEHTYIVICRITIGISEWMNAMNNRFFFFYLHNGIMMMVATTTTITIFFRWPIITVCVFFPLTNQWSSDLNWKVNEKKIQFFNSKKKQKSSFDFNLMSVCFFFKYIHSTVTFKIEQTLFK